MKQISISNAASGNTFADRPIAPGTTAADVLRDINLPHGILSRGDRGEIFANSENIYEKVKDGEKLFASTPAQVGSPLFESVINKALEKLVSKLPHWSALEGGGGLRHLRQSRIVLRQPVPYWLDHGWKKQGSAYAGKFITPYGAYFGWISQPSPSEIQFYIQHPPNCVLSSSHSACFRPQGTDNWYLVHMARRPQDISAGILTIEQLITEGFRGRA